MTGVSEEYHHLCIPQLPYYPLLVGMITYNQILGSATSVEFAQRLHDLEHQGQLDYVMLSSDDIQRRRLKVTTQQGSECGIALARDQQLFGGAILSLSDEYALVVRCTDVQWLRCHPADSGAAIELGYFAGNMHWSVRFADDILEIEIKGRQQDYVDRLQPLIASQKVRILAEVTHTHHPDSAHAHGTHSH